MCLTIQRPKLGEWKKLGNQVIYFYQKALFKISQLKFINIETKDQMDYQINLKNIGLLKILKRLLIFIEQDEQTIISKLDKRTLTKKVFYKIFRRDMFSNQPIYHYQRNFIYSLKNNRIIQMRRNKLIRKYKGKLNEIAPDYLVIRLAIKCFHQSKCEPSFFLKLWKVFERAFNISLSNLSKQYEINTFNKYGDFIILSKNKSIRYRPGVKLHPNYYIDINYFIYGKGQTGMFYLEYDEKLKQIECFDKKIYLLIKQQKNIHVARLENNIRCFIFTKQNMDKCLIKPLLTKNNLIFTNNDFQKRRDIPIYQKIDLIENQ